MKIAFLRLSSSVELDLMNASINTLGTELRVGLLKSLIDQGHQVTIYSGIKNSDQPLIKNSSLFGDVNWLTKLRYEPLKYPTDEDLLIIEQGAENLMPSYHINGQDISYMKRTFDCIHNYSGTVVYYQHGCLPFPFRVTKVSSTDAELNIGNLNKRTNLFGDKRWIVWHHFTDINHFLEGDKYQYHFYPGKFEFRFTPVPHSDVEPWFPVNPKPEYDAMFIGSQWDSRSSRPEFERSKNILRLYNIEGMNNAIIGKWDTKNFGNVKYLGMLGKHGDAYRYWNNSYVCIYTTSDFVGQCGLMPSRLTMALRSGCILLADSRLAGVSSMVDDIFKVTTKEDVSNIINHIKTLSVEEREFTRKSQLSRYPKWDDIKMEEIIKCNPKSET